MAKPTSKRTSSQPNQPRRRLRWLVWGAMAVTIGYLAWNQESLRLAWKLSSARSALANRNPERAIAILNSARQLAPENGEVEYLSAKALRRQGRLDEANKSLKRALDRGFDRKLLQREQWLAAAQAGQMSIAEPHLSELLMDARDEGADICEAFVNGYFRIGNPQRALPILEAWQKEFPKDERPWICLASFHETSGSWEQAETMYREALQRAPDDSDTQLSLATVLVNQHKFRDAESLLKQCLQESPDAPRVLEAWGNCQWAMGKPDAATETFRKLVKIDPNSEAARWGLARQAALDRDHERALVYLQPLVDEFPFKAEYRHALSQAFQATGETDLAREQFRWIADADEALARATSIEERLQSDPNNAALRYELGTIQLRYSRPEQGVQMLLSVLDVAPHHTDARAALAAHYHRQGNEKLAARFAPPGQSSPPPPRSP